jgi:hypothetical protein
MLKEFVARIFLLLLIVGFATEAAHDGENSDIGKQQPSPGSKNAAVSIPSETAN